MASHMRPERICPPTRMMPPMAVMTWVHPAKIAGIRFPSTTGGVQQTRRAVRTWRHPRRRARYRHHEELMKSHGSSGLRHLRAHGAYLHKRSTVQHLTLVATKGEVAEAPYDRVTEAFGVENHPHLLHTLEDGDEPLKRRVLRAMTSLFRLPRDLVMCLKLGVLELIENGLAHDDREIRDLSAEVLSVIADAPCGQAALLESQLARRLLSAFSAAPAGPLSNHLYDTLIAISRTFIGARQLAEAGYLPVVVGHLSAPRSIASRQPQQSEASPVPAAGDASASAVSADADADGSSHRADGERRLRALRLLKHLVNDGVEVTVYRALELGAVGECTRHLRAADFRVRAAACDALGALAFVDKAKKAAVDAGAVPRLCRLLRDAHWEAVAAGAGALMVLAVRDEAKRQLLAADALAEVNALLQSPQRLVQLNAAKLVAVAAAYPPARRALAGATTEYFLRALAAAADADPLLARSARAALQVVQWAA